MNDNQIRQITDAIYIMKDEILSKLVDIYYVIINVESELIKINKHGNNQSLQPTAKAAATQLNCWREVNDR